jgi:hypothetical protein
VPTSVAGPRLSDGTPGLELARSGTGRVRQRPNHSPSDDVYWALSRTRVGVIPEHVVVLGDVPAGRHDDWRKGDQLLLGQLGNVIQTPILQADVPTDSGRPMICGRCGPTTSSRR